MKNFYAEISGNIISARLSLGWELVGRSTSSTVPLGEPVHHYIEFGE
jgi:hypothetical protein